MIKKLFMHLVFAISILLAPAIAHIESGMKVDME
jgi:hypothetical protein